VGSCFSGRWNVSRPRPRKRQRGRPPRSAQPLCRKRILDAALSLLDDEGLAGLTMRGLAGRLGVTPMSLYNHYPTRETLLDALHEAVLADAPRPRLDEHTPWKAALLAVARTLRRGLQAHPNALLLFATRPVRTGAILKVLDERLRQLREAGFSDHQALYLIDCLVMLTVGHALAEFGSSSAARPDRDGSELLAQDAALAEAGLHDLRRVVAATHPHDYEGEIETGLRALIDGFDLQRA